MFKNFKNEIHLKFEKENEIDDNVWVEVYILKDIFQ